MSHWNEIAQSTRVLADTTQPRIKPNRPVCHMSHTSINSGFAKIKVSIVFINVEECVVSLVFKNLQLNNLRMLAF